MTLVRDTSDFVRIIKRIAKDTIENDKPTRLMYGKVTSVSPLKVNIEQRMEIDRRFLVIVERLTKGDDKLRVGDKVALLREQGGQKFLIIDRVVSG